MSDFFEPAPPPPQPEPEYTPPPWVGPPPGTLPGVVAVELVLARREQVAVYIAGLFAYPSGFEFELITVASADSDELDPMMFGPHRRRGRGRAPEALDPDVLRIGVQFSDGGRATNVGGFHHGEDPPAGPVMQGGGGGGGGGRWRQTQWVWPLPPPGPLSFVCEWPAAGIELTRSEIQAERILEAAGRAQALFASGPDPGLGFSSSTFAAPPQVKPD